MFLAVMTLPCEIHHFYTFGFGGDDFFVISLVQNELFWVIERSDDQTVF